jgi:predicted dehydrogenase
MLSMGIIGLGGWGRRLVGSVQGKSDRLRFTAAASGSSGTAKPFAEQHGLTLHADVASLLADPTIAAVVSAGPAGLHASHALQALAAGKHVLAVKPMAVTKADGDALAAAAARSGRLLALGYDRCFYPNVQELRRRVAAGELGHLVHAEGDFCADRYRDLSPDSWKAAAGQVTPGSLGDHILYLMIALLGPVAEVTVAATRQVTKALPLADATAMLLKFRGGQTGLISAIGVTADLTRLHVFGDAGWAEMRGMTELTLQRLSGAAQSIPSQAIDAQRVELEAFADAVAGRAEFPVPLAEAVHGVAVLEAMAKSAASGKTEFVA